MTFKVFDTKTGQEADIYEIALYETWARNLCYRDMQGWFIGEDGSLILADECGNYAFADMERFKIVFEENKDGIFYCGYDKSIYYGRPCLGERKCPFFVTVATPNGFVDTLKDVTCMQKFVLNAR